MPRKRRRNDMRAGELNLTAMIDMAFQLLSFFIITVAPVEVVTHLNANHVAPDVSKPQTAISNSILRIKVLSDGNYAFNGRGVNKEALEGLLTDTARLDHKNLIEALDLCKKAGFADLSLGSAE